MDKNDLVVLMNELFKPLGYKKKGNYWIATGDSLTKSVDLQKSNFSKQYYINYGFIINKLELTTRYHVHYRLSGSVTITQMLDLESNLNKEKEQTELKGIIIEKIVNKLQSINTEIELLEEVNKMPFLSTLPIVVKNYFNMRIE